MPTEIQYVCPPLQPRPVDPACEIEVEAVLNRHPMCLRIVPMPGGWGHMTCRRPRGHGGIHVAASARDNDNPDFAGRVWARWFTTEE